MARMSFKAHRVMTLFGVTARLWFEKPMVEVTVSMGAPVRTHYLVSVALTRSLAEMATILLRAEEATII